jgi:hypothetical protein
MRSVPELIWIEPNQFFSFISILLRIQPEHKTLFTRRLWQKEIDGGVPGYKRPRKPLRQEVTENN